MKVLRQRLAKAGISGPFLKRVVLPAWWDDEIAASRGGFLEGVGYICSHLGYSLACLIDENQPLAFAHQGGVKYKKAKSLTTEDVCLATNLSIGVARSVAGTLAAAPVTLPSPEEWRQSLLATSEQPWVNLPHILRASWAAGVPVLHLRNLPPRTKKPDALTTMIGDRPVIVVLNGRKSPSWIAFIVAHELGHIQRGHLKPGHTLVDEKIVTQAGDPDESEANSYALKLLTGFSNLSLGSTRSLNAPQLAAEAVVFGKNYHVAPGVAALNYGFTTGLWPLVMSALSILEKDEDAAVHLKIAMEDHLKPEALSEEAWAWVSRATASE